MELPYQPRGQTLIYPTVTANRWEYKTTLSASWEICMQDKNQQLELDMEQWTGSKLGKEYSRLYIITLLI